MEKRHFLRSGSSTHYSRFHQRRAQSRWKGRSLVMRKILVTLSGTHGTGKSTNAGQCYYLLNRKGLRFSYLVHQDILDPFGFIVRRAARVLGLSENELQKRRPVRVLWSLYLLLVYFPILGR